jgi:hypothetical protein
MLNEPLTRRVQFSLKFCETVFQSSGRGVGEWSPRQEVIVSTFAIIGAALALLCILGSLTASAREPQV